MQKIIDDFLAAVAIATTQADIDRAVTAAILAVSRIASPEIIAAAFRDSPLPPAARRGIKDKFLSLGVMVDARPYDGRIS